LPTFTTESGTKFVPSTVRVNAAEPASTEDGDVDEIEGVGLTVGLIVKVTARVSPPPGVGVDTSMFAVPGFSINEAETSAVRVLVFTKMELRPPPFHRIVEAGVKLLPVTVRVNRGCPAWMLVGEIAEIAGAG